MAERKERPGPPRGLSARYGAISREVGRGESPEHTSATGYEPIKLATAAPPSVRSSPLLFTPPTEIAFKIVWNNIRICYVLRCALLFFFPLSLFAGRVRTHREPRVALREFPLNLYSSSRICVQMRYDRAETSGWFLTTGTKILTTFENRTIRANFFDEKRTTRDSGSSICFCCFAFVLCKVLVVACKYVTMSPVWKNRRGIIATKWRRCISRWKRIDILFKAAFRYSLSILRICYSLRHVYVVYVRVDFQCEAAEEGEERDKRARRRSWLAAPCVVQYDVFSRYTKHDIVIIS